jgi:membrane fusion protein (multidrug efflux system)
MKMYTRIIIAIIGVVVFTGALGLIKGLQIKSMIAHGQKISLPPQTVTVSPVARSEWERTIQAVGSLQAVKGIAVTAEHSGKITRIAFKSGSFIKAGELLVQQDISTEKAQLQSALSEVNLAQKEFERGQLLIKKNIISKSVFDARKSAYEKAAAQVELIQSAIDKKTIRAPFSGRLGIRQVSLGEVLNGGQLIVSLQSLDPIYVNFKLPQHFLSRLSPGYTVRIDTDILNDKVEGKISALNPEVDTTTRNISVQGILPNTKEALRPGMFVNVSVVMPSKKEVLTIPTTAISYAPYADSVFIVEKKSDAENPETLVLRQQFVRLGEKRGDYVAVEEGIQFGESVVSTGVFKLRNGQEVIIDNNQAPAFELVPKPEDT